MPDGRPTQRLDFETIKLWEIAPEVLEQPELAGLLPPLPLTKGGKKRETVERMLEDLIQAGRPDLLVVSYGLAVLVFTAKDDEAWLKASFAMFHDAIKDTWVFQGIRQEGLEEGLQQGVQQGLQQAKQQDLLRYVELRFPTLLALAKQAVEQKLSLEQLQLLLDKLYLINTFEEAQTILLANE